jgi:hypothetical protein
LTRDRPRYTKSCVFFSFYQSSRLFSGCQKCQRVCARASTLDPCECKEIYQDLGLMTLQHICIVEAKLEDWWGCFVHRCTSATSESPGNEQNQHYPSGVSNSDQDCHSLFEKVFSCNNGGIGGYVDVGCLRYLFTGAEYTKQDSEKPSNPRTPNATTPPTCTKIRTSSAAQ